MSLRTFGALCGLAALLSVGWAWLPRPLPATLAATTSAGVFDAPPHHPTDAATLPDFGGRYGESDAAVSRAEALAHYTLGSELLGDGDYYSAASHLAVAREALGDFGRICELLAATYDRLNMTPDLRTVMRCLAREAREHDSARALYDHLARHLGVEEEFAAAASDHFVASFPRSGLSSSAIGRVLDILENARSEIAAGIGVASRRIVPVVVYEGEQFAAATHKPHWALGLYDGKIRVAIDTFAERPDVFEIAIAHEYVHALTHEYTGTRLPAWFREGLADALARRGTHHAPAAAWRWSATEPVFAYADLAHDFIGLPDERAAAAYRQSYALVHNLVAEADWGPIRDLLLDLHANEALSFEAAFAGVYGESAEAYVDRWYDRVAN